MSSYVSRLLEVNMGTGDLLPHLSHNITAIPVTHAIAAVQGLSQKRPVTFGDLARLASEIQSIGVEHWAFIGGAANIAYGGSRATEDMDLVMYYEGGIDSVFHMLGEREGFKIGTGQYGEKTLTFNGSEVEIFDIPSWRDRPQYATFVEEGGFTLIDTDIAGVAIKVVSPSLHLREKLITHQDRRNPDKRLTDRNDITFMLDVCQEKGITLDLRDDTEINRSAKKGLDVYLEGQDTPDIIELAKSVVLR